MVNIHLGKEEPKMKKYVNKEEREREDGFTYCISDYTML